MKKILLVAVLSSLFFFNNVSAANVPLNKDQLKTKIAEIVRMIGVLQAQLVEIQKNTLAKETVMPAASFSANTTICNGIYYKACPIGQELFCTTDGVTTPYCQIHPSVATAEQIAGIALLCSNAAAQGNTDVVKYCNDGTILNGYNSSAIFRKNIDGFVQQIKQKLNQQQENCLKSFVAPYDPTMTASANLLNMEINSANETACLKGTASAGQQAQQDIQQAQTNYQLQQLKSSIDANTAAIEAQKRAQESQKVMQQIQQQQQTITTPKQKHCFWNAGVLDCNTLIY